MDIKAKQKQHSEHWVKASAIRALTLDAVAAANSGHSGRRLAPRPLVLECPSWAQCQHPLNHLSGMSREDPRRGEGEDLRSRPRPPPPPPGLRPPC